MDSAVSHPDTGAPEGARSPRRPVALLVLAGILFLQGAALAVLTAVLVVELVIAVPVSYGSAVVLTLLTGAAAAWLGAIAVNLLRGRAWTRGAAITTQVLQVAISIGSFQGLFAQPAVGWAILVPAVIALVLLFTRSVVAATARRDEI
ncbi:hypothetical protein [Marisediminicola sp. LYQ134]|uniref:hypothetical protein n=1 Tax=unclassified Marisediminicola TaxID=2618316 RepID=UPI003982F1A9